MTAFSVGFLHTILGPDHYIPFVAMARSNGWSAKKTFSVTACCGIGHLAGSVLIGCVGLMLGSMLMEIEALEAFRGGAAAWLLIGFGVAYLTWGIISAVRDIPHTHMHSHGDGRVHSHLHKHDLEHLHVHETVQIEQETSPFPNPLSTGEETNSQPAAKKLGANGQRADKRSLTPWLLFLIFAFGPCEVLIPLLMYPAAEANSFAIFAVVLAFSVATVGTMLSTVMLIVFGLNFVRIPDLHRYNHAIAGFAVLLCGVLVKFGL
jgi:ABC-type nickel/cobalt efflux system permease component RcnA